MLSRGSVGGPRGSGAVAKLKSKSTGAKRTIKGLDDTLCPRALGFGVGNSSAAPGHVSVLGPGLSATKEKHLEGVIIR